MREMRNLEMRHMKPYREGAVNTVQLIVIEMAHTQQEEEEIAAR